MANQPTLSAKQKRSNLLFALTFPLFFMVMFPALFVTGLHMPIPHDVPVAVAGPGADKFVSQVGPKLDGKVEFSTVDSVDEGKQLIEKQKIRAVYVPGQGTQDKQGKAQPSTLYTAGADGRLMASMLPTIFKPIAQASGTQLQTQDVAPLAKGDGNGIGLMFFMLVSVLVGFLTGNIVGNAAFFLRMRVRLPISAIVAVVTPCVLFAIMGGILHVLAGSPGQIAAAIVVAACASFTAGLIVHATVVFLGKWTVFPTILLFILSNIPSSNSAYPREFVPGFFRWLSGWHLGAATVNSERSILYFHGQGLGRPLLTMAIWLAIAIVYISLALFKRRRDALAESAESHEQHESDHQADAIASGAGPEVTVPPLRAVVRNTAGQPIAGASVAVFDAIGRQVGKVDAGAEGHFHFTPAPGTRFAQAAVAGLEAQQDTDADDDETAAVASGTAPATTAGPTQSSLE